MPSHRVVLCIVFLLLSILVPSWSASEPSPAATGPLYRFVNQTNAFTDEQILWSLDGGKTWTTIAEKPTVACPRGNGRVYFAFGTPPKNFGDRTAYWDFIEYASNASDRWSGNTTQVDAFCAPLTIAMGDRLLGITKPRAEIFAAYREQAPGPFKELLRGDVWILSPAMGPFGAKGTHAKYFDSYVDEVWAMYEKERPTPSGKWTGKVVDGALIFTEVGGKKTYTCTRKPSTQDILLGTGVLGANPRFCGAFNRHVAADPADWNDATKFYRQEPCNWYAKFLHEHSLANKAYGFCYDDDADQAAFFMGKGTEVVVTFYWNAPSAEKPKDKKKKRKETPTK